MSALIIVDAASSQQRETGSQGHQGERAKPRKPTSGYKQVTRGPGAMVWRGESAAPWGIFLGPGSESTESSVVVMCTHVISPFSHKGANARGALTTLVAVRVAK